MIKKMTFNCIFVGFYVLIFNVQAVQAETLARVNCGDGGIQTFDGEEFSADKYFVGTTTADGFTDPTTLSPIYITNRYDGFSGAVNYEIPVTNSDYTVTLHFAETYHSTIGSRIFDVNLEGVTVLDDFDIIDVAGGPLIATTAVFFVTVNDGVMNIDLLAGSADRPKLSAFEIASDNGRLRCEWADLADATHNHIEGQSAVVNGKLYAFGGLEPNPVGGGLISTQHTDIYDPITDAWSSGTDMPTVLTHAGMQAVGDEIWHIGGFEGEFGATTDKVQIYNTVTDTWRAGPTLPNSRGAVAAVLHDGKIHIFGGLLPDRQTDVGEHYFYDINNEALGWQVAAAMPEPRNHHAGAVLNGLIYAIGGQIGHDKEADGTERKQTNFVHAYNPATDTWTQVADLPYINSHFEASTLTHNGKIMIAGGVQGGDTITNAPADDILEYDPVLDMWSMYCKLPSITLTPIMMVSGDKLIITGGGEPSNFTPNKRTRWVPITPATVVTDPEAETDPETEPEDNDKSSSGLLTIWFSFWVSGLLFYRRLKQ